MLASDLSDPESKTALRGYSLWCEGVECITLGHGLKGPVVEHPLWGTQQIVDFLEGCSGFPEVRLGKNLTQGACSMATTKEASGLAQGP